MKSKSLVTICQGDDGLYGVCQGSGIIYEPDFEKNTAERIVDFMNDENNPDIDWLEMAELLVNEGFEV